MGGHAIIAINIGAAVAHLLADPDTRRRMAEEEAQSAITDEALRRLQESSVSLAAKLAPVMAQDWINELRDKNVSGIKTKALRIQELPELPSSSPAGAGKSVQDDGNDGNGAHPTKRR